MLGYHLLTVGQFWRFQNSVQDVSSSYHTLLHTYIHTYMHACMHIFINLLHCAESSLQSVVQDRKALLGFIDPNLITRPDSKSVSFSPQRQLFSPPHNNRNPNNNNSKKQSHKDSRNPINLASLPNIRNISLSELPELILTRPPSHH